MGGCTVYHAFRRDCCKFLIAGLITISALSHELIFAQVDGFTYYGTAALFDVIAVIMLSNFKKTTNLIVHAQNYCLISFVVNLAGWVSWMLYIPPVGYNIASALVFMYAFLILTRNDDGDSQMARWASLFRFDVIYNHVYRSSDKDKTWKS